MMIVNQANLSLIKTQMICMVEQESFIFLTVDLSGYIGRSRSSRPEVFLGKGDLKISSKFTEEHPCRSAISIKLI